MFLEYGVCVTEKERERTGRKILESRLVADLTCLFKFFCLLEHLAVSVSSAYSSWYQGCEFNPTLGLEVTSQQLKNNFFCLFPVVVDKLGLACVYFVYQWISGNSKNAECKIYTQLILAQF